MIRTIKSKGGCASESVTVSTRQRRMNDMASVTAVGPALQRIADIVSGFSATFGMKIATTKLRPFQANFGKEQGAEYTLDNLVIP